MRASRVRSSPAEFFQSCPIFYCLWQPNLSGTDAKFMNLCMSS